MIRKKMKKKTPDVRHHLMVLVQKNIGQHVLVVRATQQPHSALASLHRTRGRVNPESTFDENEWRATCFVGILRGEGLVNSCHHAFDTTQYGHVSSFGVKREQ